LLSLRHAAATLLLLLLLLLLQITWSPAPFLLQPLVKV
jgi:hypothetical protein